MYLLNQLNYGGLTRRTRRLPRKAIPRILLANVLFVLAIKATKEWLLEFDAGVIWVLIRVLACGGIGVLAWEVTTGQMAKRKSIEVSGVHPVLQVGF